MIKSLFHLRPPHQLSHIRRSFVKMRPSQSFDNISSLQTGSAAIILAVGLPTLFQQLHHLQRRWGAEKSLFWRGELQDLAC